MTQRYANYASDTNRAEPTWGFQATVTFAAGTPARRPTPSFDAANDHDVSLWRVSAQVSPAGDTTQRVLAQLIYGTGSSMQLSDIVLPLVAYVPGSVALYLYPESDVTSPIVVMGNVKPVTGYEAQTVRTWHETPGQLPPSVVTFTATGAGTVVTTQGVAVPLAIGQSIPIMGPSSLTAGSGLGTHEL